MEKFKGQSRREQGRGKRGHRVVSMDMFFNGWGFALAFAVVRMLWCR
jgi:hypothetical protein